jgi:hypothetical protein
MSTVSEVLSSTQAAQTSETTGASKTSKVTGKTIGNPQLSENAAKYYEELKKKYSNMDFILVSSDMKETAKSSAASYANPYKIAVLIDEEKIEKMAENEDYRQQYESIIANAASGISQLAQQLTASGASVKGYGIQVNDGGNASFFAVVDKSLAAQRERIEKKAAEKKEAKKTEEKKAEEKKAEEKAEAKKAQKKETEELARGKDSDSVRGGDEVIVTASSVEELIQKLEDMTFAERSDWAQTEEERKVGQNIDFSV